MGDLWPVFKHETASQRFEYSQKGTKDPARRGGANEARSLAGGQEVILGKSQFLTRQNEPDFNQGLVGVRNNLCYYGLDLQRLL